MIRNLGKVATILARAEAFELDLHADIDNFNAPSECHGIIKKGEARRLRQAKRWAKATANRPFRIIQKELAKRGCPIHSPRWDRFVYRLCVF